MGEMHADGRKFTARGCPFAQSWWEGDNSAGAVRVSTTTCPRSGRCRNRLDDPMTPTTYRAARRLPLTAAAGLALALVATACDGSTMNSAASPPTSVVPPAATTPASGPPPPAPSSSGHTSAAPSSVPPAPTTPPGPGRCHTADLAAALGEPDSGMGHTGVTLVLTNRSTRPCRVYGYGGLQLLDAAGRPLPTRQVRIPSPRPRSVTLAPGARAHSDLYWVSMPMEKPCPQSAVLLVIPPDETEQLRTAGLGSVCEQGRIQQSAYAAGASSAD
jgi:hypothetical protein